MNDINILNEYLNSIIREANQEQEGIDKLVRLLEKRNRRIARLMIEEERTYNEIINHPDYTPMELKK